MTKIKTRDVEPGMFRATVVPSSWDSEKRTVEIVWSTGARVLRGHYEPFYEELSMKPKHVRMERMKSGSTPLLNSHRSEDLSDVIGVVEKAAIKGGEGTATVRFASDPDSELVASKVRDGIVKNISVGYRTYKLELVEQNEGDHPVYRATDWEPHEVSFVPMGADVGASVRSIAQHNQCEFIKLADDQEQRSMKTKATEIKEESQTVDAVAPAKVVVPTAEQRRSILAEDRKRTAGIQRCARALGISEEMVSKHIEDGTSIGEFRKHAFDDFEARSTPHIPDVGNRPNITPGDDAKDKFARGVSNWLITRASSGKLITEDAKRRGEKVDLDPGEFRGMTLLDLCRASLEMNGQSSRGLSKVDLAGKALSFRSGGGYAGVSDFPVLLENTLHKLLLASYNITPDTWSKFCHTGSVSDFRAHNRYRQGTFGVLDLVAEGGEFKNKTIPDARKESITAATKGNIIMLSRQAIINDDMDAFSRIAAQIGRAGRLSVESDVYALLAENSGLGPSMSDGLTMFHANHGNLGSGAALSVASVDADRVVMKTQTDESGNEILDLVPSILLVSAGLGGLARSINGAQYNIDDNGSLEPNTVQGLYREVVDTGRMAGTRRYSFADPSESPCVEVAFLDGQQEPYMEMQEGWTTDGMQWKVRLDYAVAGIDYRGGVTNAGQ